MSAPMSPPQRLTLESRVHARHIVAVAVERRRRPPLAGADDFLARLAPARMRHRRIDIGPETIFGRRQRFPKALRPPVGEAEARDRFDRLESVFPRHREAQRRALLLG